MATTHRGPDSEVGLNIRWYREGHSIDIGKHVVDAFIGPRSEGFGQFGGAGERASPHADQVGIGVRGPMNASTTCLPMSMLWPSRYHRMFRPTSLSGPRCVVAICYWTSRWPSLPRQPIGSSRPWTVPVSVRWSSSPVDSLRIRPTG